MMCPIISSLHSISFLHHLSSKASSLLAFFSSFIVRLLPYRWQKKEKQIGNIWDGKHVGVGLHLKVDSNLTTTRSVSLCHQYLEITVVYVRPHISL